MKLSQIINLAKPVAYWTGERYGDNNVYDEKNVNPLVATNVTLGDMGSNNRNLSSRSINLNGGYLQVYDTSFLDTDLVERDFTIGFGMRIPNRDHTQPIAGFKTLISKWNPEQQFMIGFENGNLVAKVQTVTGLVELELDRSRTLYNNRWNWVQFTISPSKVELHLNGVGVEKVDNTAITGSVNNLFTVGGTGAEMINNDVLINDIAVCDKVVNHMAEAAYILPRTELEMWQDLSPIHLFSPGTAINPLDALENLGTSNEVAYIVYEQSGDEPYHKVYDQLTRDQTLRMPPNSWLAIDTDDIPFDTIQGVSVMVHGRFDRPNDRYNNDAMYLFDLKNNTLNNNGGIESTLNGYRGDSYAWIYSKTFDVDGNDITVDTNGYNNSTYSYTTRYHNRSGTKLYSYKLSNLDAYQYGFGYWTAQTSYKNIPFNYNKTLPLKLNKFWHCTGKRSCDWSELRHIALFDYKVNQDVCSMVNYPRFKLIHQYMYSSNPIGWGGTLHGYSSTSPNLRRERYDGSYDLDDESSNLKFVTNFSDPAQRRNNALQGAIYLETLGSYVRGDYRYSRNPRIDSNDFTICGFYWNRNTTDRYKFLKMDSDRDLEVWMNSRDGVFSHGDIEFSMDEMIPEQTFSTKSKKIVDDGFHHIALVRKQFELQIWIDGLLDTTLITPSIVDVYHSSSLQTTGGPLYFNDLLFINKRALEPHEIEWAYGGYNDIVKGQCTLDGQPLPSTMLVATTDTGDVIKSNITQPNGKFEVELPKGTTDARVNLLALAQDDNATNNVVIHGPYNMTAVYSKYSDEVLTNSLEDMILDMEPYAYYPLNETTGTTVNDASGNARHATLQGGMTLDHPAMESGSRSVKFDGTSGYIEMPDGFDDFTTGFTVEAWVKYDSFKKNSRLFEIASGIDGADSLAVGNYSTGDELIVINRDDTGSETVNGQVNDVLTNSGWQHITLRITASGTYSLWSNGHKIWEQTSQTMPTAVLRTLAYIGKSSYANDDYFDGRMSQIATYMHPLSDEDIAKHAYRGFGKTLPTMKSLIMQDEPDLYFPFNRVDTYLDAVDSDLLLTQNGSFNVDRNTLVFNKDITGNNWLAATGYRMPNTGKGWAIEFSIKTGITHTDATVISEWDQGTDTGTYKVQLDASNKVKVFVNNSSTVIESSIMVNDDVWHHVFVDYDGDTVSLYVDGEYQTALSTTVGMDLHDLAIGNSQDGAVTHHFEGKTALDDVAIYGHTVNDVRIGEHYNQFLKKKVYQ